MVGRWGRRGFWSGMGAMFLGEMGESEGATEDGTQVFCGWESRHEVLVYWQCGTLLRRKDRNAVPG